VEATTKRGAPRGEVAPLTMLLGDLFIRILEWGEHIDFVLSVKDEKVATMLQFFRDSGWVGHSDSIRYLVGL